MVPSLWILPEKFNLAKDGSNMKGGKGRNLAKPKQFEVCSEVLRPCYTAPLQQTPWHPSLAVLDELPPDRWQHCN